MAQLNFLNDFQGHDVLQIEMARSRACPDEGYKIRVWVEEKGANQLVHESYYTDLMIDCLDDTCKAIVQAFLWGDHRQAVSAVARHHRKDAGKYQVEMRKAARRVEH